MEDSRRTHDEVDPGRQLSPREKQLIHLAEHGYTDHGIAKEAGISLATVGTYWGRIRVKYGPLSRTEIVARYLKDEAAKTVELLRIDNARLLQEVEQLSRKVEQLQSSLDLFREVIEIAADAVLMVDSSGTIRLSNARAEALLGFDEHELLGFQVDDLVPQRYRSQHMSHRNDYWTSPTKRAMGEHLATHALRKDGTEIRIAAALSSVRMGQEQLATCIIRPLVLPVKVTDSDAKS